MVEANQHKRADTGGSAGREIGVTLQVIEATHLSHLRLFGQLKFQHCPPSMAGRVPSVQSSQSAPHLIIADSLPLLWRQHWRPTRPNVIIELFHFYNHDLLPLVECKISFDPLVFFMLVVDHYQFSEMCTETQKKGILEPRRKETKSNSSFLRSWMLCWISNGLQLQ